MIMNGGTLIASSRWQKYFKIGLMRLVHSLVLVSGTCPNRYANRCGRAHHCIAAIQLAPFLDRASTVLKRKSH